MKSEELIRKYSAKYTRNDVDGEIMMTLSHILMDISRKEATYMNAVSVVMEYIREYNAKLNGNVSIETADDFDEKGELKII